MSNSNNFDEVMETRFHNQKIKIQALITGKTITPYHVPKVISIQCENPKCKNCRLQEPSLFEVPMTDESILSFIDLKSIHMTAQIRSMLDIKCNLSFEIKEVQYIDRIFIARPTGKERTRKGGGTRAAYMVGVSLEANNVYELEGYTTTEPLTQGVTHVFTSAVKMSKDIETFNLSAKKHTELSQFCISDKLTVLEVYDRLAEIYESYSHNVTKIYERFDLHLAVDLMFRSVMSFYFDNEFVFKGWMEAMIIGDTRCGKGYVAEKMVNYFGMGETVSGENASFAGLVGGLQQFNNHWAITWGKIPMNDCGMLVVDETSGMEENMWGKLSRIRSEGVAEITKIHTQVTNARTRLLFICNPKNRTVSSYTYGISALPDLIRAPEDIARFDYVLVVTHNEVKGSVINQRREPVKRIFDEKLEQDLILWCWSRRPDQVRFTKEAIKSTYEISLKLEKMFDFSIPLIQVENVRYKLAKIAIAFAARFYSNEDKGQTLLVKEIHVECAYMFLVIIYGKEQCGYMAYSTMQKSTAEMVTPEKLQSLEKYFDSWKLQKPELLRCLMSNNNINPDDITVHLGCRKEDGIECVSRLLKAGCLSKRTGYYIKTPDFTLYLKRKVLNQK